METTYKKPPRSGLLTALCVLTMLGSAYGIFSGILLAVTAKKIEGAISVEISTNDSVRVEGNKGMPADSIANMKPDSTKKNRSRLALDIGSMASEEKLQANAIFQIISNIITFIGAIFMFRQNRVGFWIYLAGSLMGIIAPLLVFGWNSVSSLVVIGPVLVAITFIMLYAFCLKEMKEQEVYE